MNLQNGCVFSEFTHLKTGQDNYHMVCSRLKLVTVTGAHEIQELAVRYDTLAPTPHVSLQIFMHLEVLI